MKYEEKIKFIMRSLELNLARLYNRPAQKMLRFNIQEQQEFFKREEVHRHFKEEMPKIIWEKKKAND